MHEKAVEAQEKAAEAKSGLVDEVRLLRLSQTENSAPKNEALKTRCINIIFFLFSSLLSLPVVKLEVLLGLHFFILAHFVSNK